MPARAIYMDCAIDTCTKKNVRNGPNGATCTADRCKRKYAKQRRELDSEPAGGDGGAAVLASADVMPANMWVNDVEEILGERCCERHKLSRVRRKRGPGSAARQQFLVRGGFLVDDDESDTEDTIPDNDTFWVDKDVLLDTIDKADVKAALKKRYESVIAGL